MEAHRWNEVQASFDELVELDATTRAHRLAQLASTDPELHRALESLLAADAAASTHLASLESVVSRAVAAPYDLFGIVGTTISHYRVLEPLGVGGMGIVYRAEDTRLKRMVALKFLLPHYGADASAKERFLREARAAAALDHPNLCTIHDFGESTQGRLFLAMVLCPGEPLSTRLARDGRLPMAEAMAIAQQLLEGLEYAHGAGIVHRDLKPGNIMLLPNGGVKILDFGLAKARDESLSAPSARMGTASYMAPEQIQGETVDARTDLWAVGVVLYEMLTGRKPFIGDNDIAAAHAIVHDRLLPPSAVHADAAAVDDIILTLLEKNPARRYPSAAAVRQAISSRELRASTSGRSRLTGQSWMRAQLWLRSWPGLAVVGAVLVAMGATVVGLRVATSRASQSVAIADRAAVLPFHNLSRDTALNVLGQIAADWISRQLLDASIKVVPPLELVSQTGSGGDTGGLDTDALRKEALALRAGTLIYGSYYRRGDTLIFQPQVLDVELGVLQGGVPLVRGPLADPMEVIGRLSERVSGVVATKLELLVSATLVRPPTLDAYRMYVEGHREMLRHNWMGALDLFLKSGAADSAFYATLYAAATAAVNVGRWNVVDSLVKVMGRNSARLAPLDRVNYEYLQARLNGDLREALAASREQARLAPGTIYHFMNGYEALRSNRPREAVDILSAMDPDRGMLRGWLSYWGILVIGRHLIGDHRHELVDVRTAVGRFPEFSGWVRPWEAKALAAGDQVPDLVRWVDSIPPPPSRRAAQRGVLMEIAASELWGHGHTKASIELYRQAVESYNVALREQPDDEDIAFNLGRSLLALGRTDEALSVARRLRATFPVNVNHLGLLGTIEASRGERAGAAEIAQQLRSWDEPYLFGRPSYWLAAIEAHGGDLDRAVEMLSRAFQQGTPYWGYPNAPDFGDTHTDVFLRPLRSYRPYAQLVRPRD